MPAMIGALLNGRYRLEAELGGGGMGRVYRARDTLLDRHVAVKVLSAGALGSEGRARLLREAQAVAKLNHPNVVSVYDAGEAEVPGSTGTVPFIVMELVEGASLHDCPPGSLDEILGIACQVCAALDHAHAHDVIHRDLKPENVLILPDGSAKLVDFGLARTVASRLTAEGAILGTVFYISPEQALGQEIDGRADLYALGVMLYEWTAGRLPFEGDDPLTLIGQHLHARVMPPREHNPEIPPALDALIVQLMSKRPEDRPASAAEVRQVLEALGQGPAAKEVPLDRPRQPGFLTGAEERTVERPAFVARERELARLGGFLTKALAGQGGVVFVTGGPGRGKTALLEAFARQAMDERDELLVASGTCNAYSGVGDPYLPFREVLGMLSGEVEAHWAAGTISRDHALRLWQALPATVEALLAHGPHVVPALVSGEALLARASAACPTEPWLGRLRERVERRPAAAEGLEQSHLFQQVSNVLHALAQVHPLLLILDDLQWVDWASAGLLFHVGRRLAGARILITGAYRPEEVTLGLEPRGRGEGERHERVPERHPLEKVLTEFKRLYGDVWLDLAEVDVSEGRRFVDALLETEPNCLGEGFRQTLVERAQGHPLFTVELLQAMQERGNLVRDEAGRWVEGASLDWEGLPARVEAAIAERIERLEAELRDLLTVACVEGEDFTAEVVAQVRAVEARDLVRRLSGELQQQHRLVRAQGLRRLGARRLALYRFQHHLFQKYLYNHLDQVERAYLHEDVGTVLEALYGDQADEVTVQLARHFLEAGVTGKAVHYLGRAGALAAARYANVEAEGHYRAALELVEGEAGRADLLGELGRVLNRQSRYDEAMEVWQEGIALYQGLGMQGGVTRLYARMARAASALGDPPRGLRLGREGLAAVAAAPESPDLADLLHETARSCWLNGLPDEAASLCRQALEMAERLGDVRVQAEALCTLGILVPYDESVSALTRAVELAESAGLLDQAARAHNNLGAVVDDAQACLEHMLRAAELARQTGEIVSELYFAWNAAFTSLFLGDLAEADEVLPSLWQLLDTAENPGGMAIRLRSLEAMLLRYQGKLTEAIDQLRPLRLEARAADDLQALAHVDEELAITCLWEEVGEGEELEAMLQEGFNLAERGIAPTLVLFQCLLAVQRARQGESEAARQLLAEARRQAAGEGHPVQWEPTLLWAAAHVSVAESRWPEALAAFNAAVDALDGQKRRWYRARTLIDWAEAHLARGEPGDRERAGELLRAAEAEFEAMGAPLYAERVKGCLEKLDHPC